MCDGFTCSLLDLGVKFRRLVLLLYIVIAGIFLGRLGARWSLYNTHVSPERRKFGGQSKDRQRNPPWTLKQLSDSVQVCVPAKHSSTSGDKRQDDNDHLFLRTLLQFHFSVCAVIGCLSGGGSVVILLFCNYHSTAIVITCPKINSLFCIMFPNCFLFFLYVIVCCLSYCLCFI